MNRALAALALLCLAAGGCGGGTASLRYRYPRGRVSTYRWTIDGTATSPGASHTVHLEAAVREEVLASLPRGGGRLRLTLEPGTALQDARPIDPGPALSLDLDVGPDGHVIRITGTPSVPVGAIDALDLGRLLAESRPPLPARGVRLRDRWNADVSSSGAASSIRLTGTGRLEGFSLAGGRRLATIGIARQGQVVAASNGPGSVLSPTPVPAPGTLTGTATDTASARFDLDRGLVVEATSSATSAVSIPSLQSTPAGASGALDVRLTTRVTLEHAS